jgi:hypothetical protein
MIMGAVLEGRSLETGDRAGVRVERHADGVGALAEGGHGGELAGEHGDEAGAGAQLEVADRQVNGRGRPPSAGSWVQARWVLATQSGRAP